MDRKLVLTLVSTTLTLVGCGGTPGARPHDMSAQAHEQAAARQERVAERLEQVFDPLLTEEQRECATAGRRYGGPCWTSVTNPTQRYLRDAQRYHKRAADHRAASTALRNEEARACEGISESDRDISPFARREDIVGLTPVLRPYGARHQREKLVGVTVTFRNVPGLTAPWLQQAVSCHLARNAVLGHKVPDMEYCPLVPKGVSAKVKSVDGMLAIEVTSEDAEVANDVLRRAQLAATRSWGGRSQAARGGAR